MVLVTEAPRIAALRVRRKHACALALGRKPSGRVPRRPRENQWQGRPDLVCLQAPGLLCPALEATGAVLQPVRKHHAR